MTRVDIGSAGTTARAPRVSIQGFLDGLLEFRRYHPVQQNFKNWKTRQLDGLYDIDGAKWNLDEVDE